MLATHPVGYLRFLISIAALGLLAALLLLPAPVRAQTRDSIPPTLLAANVDGTSLKLIYSEALDANSVPAASAYSVVVDSGTAAAPSSVAVSGAKVTLTLSTGAANGNTVTVTYTKPSTNPLQDLAGNDAAALTDEVVVNYTDTTNHLPVFPTAPTTRSVAENTAPMTAIGTAVTATDSDSDTLTYSLPATFNNLFAVGTNGQLQTVANLDYESGTTSYVVPVYVSDSENATGGMDTVVDDAIVVTVTVTNVNEAPVITTTTSTISKPEQTTTAEILETYQASDVDAGTNLTWTLGGNDAGGFTIVGGELKFKNEPNFENPADQDNNNIYDVNVNVSDGSLSATQDVTITVTNVNEAPTITSGPMTKNVAENTMSVGSYTASDVDMPDIISWSVESGDSTHFRITNGELEFQNAPDFEIKQDDNTDNIYNVTVRATDTGGLFVTRTVAVTVTNVDEAGTASFTGTLSGGSTQTASVTDPDGGIGSKSYRWQRGMTSGGSFSNITTNATGVNYVPVAADVTKYLRVIVSYADAEGSGKSATSVSRGPIGASNSEPTFNDGTMATRTLPENSGGGENVVGGAVAATDSDSGDTLTYALKSGNDSGDFTIVSTSGQIQAKSGETYNFEVSKNSYTVIVTVHDGKDTAGDADTAVDAEITVTINLTNVNEAPVITTNIAVREIEENSRTVQSFVATDVDMLDTGMWSKDTGQDSGLFTIIASTGALSFTNAPDYEMPNQSGSTNNEYVVTVRVTDGGGLFDTHEITVTVDDVNETPTITSGPMAISKDENTPTTEIIATYVATDPDATTGTMTWDLQGNDMGDFTITSTVNGTANLYFKNVPNYEVPADTGTDNVYDVTVRVRDNASTPLQDTRDVDVTVNDVNETPVVSGVATPSFAEIEFDATSVDLAIGTYTYTDEDLNLPDTITWGLSGTDEMHFDIGSTSGALSFKMRPDFENPFGADNVYEFVVEADDGQGGVGTYNVTVTVTQVDETPEVTGGRATQTFAEIEYDITASSAERAVDTFTARDEEDGTAGIAWTLGGTDEGFFSISTGTLSGSGVLFFRPNNNRSNPDYENPDDDGGDNVYNIIVKATDTTSNTRDYTVTVTVTDVNETPEFIMPLHHVTAHEIEYDSGTMAEDLRTIDATEANRSYWYPFNVRDEEMEDITWSLSGADAGDFVITEDADGRGIVRWNIVPDFENPMGAQSNEYVYNVVISDGTNNAVYEHRVAVIDRNEAPEFTGTPNLAITYNENAITDVSSYAARDEEGVVTWSLTGADSGKFSIDSGGTVTFNATPDWETPVDDGGNNVYEFSVVATDVLSGSPRRDVSVDVTVTVADVEEAGTITVKVDGDADNNNPAVGDRVEFTLTDPDGGIDLTPPTQGQPPPIDWTLQLRWPGGAWQTKQTNNPLGTDFHYVVDEDDEGMEMRVVVDYNDRRGPVQHPVESEPTAAVTANPSLNVDPRFTSSGTQNVAEGDTGRTVGDPITATDRDNDSLTFSIEGAQADKFELVVVNNTTVRLRTAQALDFETTSGPLFLQVAVHDGKGLDSNDMVITDDSIDATTTVTVTILDVEEDGVLTLSDDEPGVGETLTTTLSDGDGMIGGQMWQWARSENGRDGWTNIGGTTSIYTTTLADADFFLRASVTYRDRRGGGKTAEAITTERVFGENQRPTFPSTETGARTVAENTLAGVSIGTPVVAEDPDEDDRLTYSLSGTDAAAFSIVTTTGQLRTLEPLDFETKPSYSVTVEVHDGLDARGQPSTSIDDMQAVTITIENVEEQGTVTLSSDTGTIQARVPVMATLADDDIPSSVTWQWARSPDGSSDWVNIAGATSATFTPTDDDEGNYIRATASYTDGHGTANKTAEEVSARVGDAPPVNSAPVFLTTETGQREVAEDVTGGSTFGAPVVATDFNNDTLYYSLSGTDAASFEIGQNDGQLRLASGVMLDFEGKRSYRFTVEVSDRADPLDDADMAIDDRQSVTVTVTNVNEAPVVTGAATASIEENSSSTLGSYSATDPERDTLTWSVSGSDFWISDGGQLYFRAPPSFETQTNYTVTVMAEDDGRLRDSLTVTVTVTDVEEDGVVTISPPRGWADTQFTAELDDDDGSISGRTWQWSRSSNRSSWTDIAGATSSSYSVADDDNQYLRVTATYDDRVDMGQTASAMLAGRIGDVKPAQNDDPVFTETAPVTRSVGQGTAAGRSIGAPVRATDPDSGDILTYSLESGQDADKFAIDPATGQLRTKDVLDYDSDPQGQNDYTVVVEVRDGFDPTYNPATGVDDRITVTITVTQVARRVFTGVGGGGGGFGPALTAPKFVDGFRTSRPLPVNALAGDAVGDPVAATHPNDDDVTYSLSGANATLFTVDEETGQIRLGQAVTLALGQSYTVNLTATDSTGTGSIIIVVIEVLEAAYHRYDQNRDGIIEKDEVVAAASDYFAELIEKPLVLEVIALYFAN